MNIFLYLGTHSKCLSGVSSSLCGVPIMISALGRTTAVLVQPQIRVFSATCPLGLRRHNFYGHCSFTGPDTIDTSPCWGPLESVADVAQKDGSYLDKNDPDKVDGPGPRSGPTVVVSAARPRLCAAVRHPQETLRVANCQPRCQGLLPCSR